MLVLSRRKGEHDSRGTKRVKAEGHSPGFGGQHRLQRKKGKWLERRWLWLAGPALSLAELGTLGDRGQEQQPLQSSSSEGRVTRQGATSSLAQKRFAQRISHP